MIDPVAFLRGALGIDLHERELAGTVFSGEIPLPNDLVNRVIAKQIRGGGAGPVTAAHVNALGDDRFAVELQVKAPIPPIRIMASIEQQPAFPSPATLGIRWSMPALGPLALFAGPAMAFLKKTPAGIRVDGDWAAIDVGEILRSRGLGDVMRYIAGARIRTRPGAFVLQFEARISP